MYPTIGLHSLNEKVEVNFGKKPFEFDLEGMMLEENENLQSEIKKSSVTSKDIHWIVKRYLIHYGYASTLEAFNEDCGLTTTIEGMEEEEEHANISTTTLIYFYIILNYIFI